MKAVSEIILPEDRRYTAAHVWAKAEGDVILAGISDFAQDQLGEVVYVDLPSEGASFKAGENFGEVESIKSVNALVMPVSGSISAVNAALGDEPTLVNSDCYGQAWMIKISPDNADDLDTLLDAASYRGGLE